MGMPERELGRRAEPPMELGRRDEPVESWLRRRGWREVLLFMAQASLGVRGWYDWESSLVWRWACGTLAEVEARC